MLVESYDKTVKRLKIPITVPPSKQDARLRKKGYGGEEDHHLMLKKVMGGICSMSRLGVTSLPFYNRFQLTADSYIHRYYS